VAPKRAGPAKKNKAAARCLWIFRGLRENRIFSGYKKMKTRPSRQLSLTLALALLPFAASAADPVLFGGHFYEVVKHNNISWSDAKAAAEGKTYLGVQGHLATLTSAAEDDFVNGLRVSAGLSRPEAWIGGSQPAGELGAGDNWSWVNGEGAIPGMSSASPYANWQTSEPNDNYGAGSEQHMALGLGNNPGWNDEGSLGNIGGYIIEYSTGTSAPVADCQKLPLGCPLAGGGITVKPPQTIAGGNNSIDAAVSFHIDPRVGNGTCGREPLVLFADDPNGEVFTISEQYCAASPDGLFAVLHLDSEVTVLDGVVDAITDPEIYFGDYALNCDLSIPVGIDPTTQQDEQVYQPSNPADIREGHAIGTISDCGTGRGKTKGLSFFAVGMGTACPDPVTNLHSSIQCQADWTKSSLHNLLGSIVDAKPALSRRDYTKMVLIGGLANLAFHFKLYDLASHKLGILIDEVEDATFSANALGNPRGDILMRAYHIKFITDVRIIGPRNH
jgi:hypothetical protein